MGGFFTDHITPIIAQEKYAVSGKRLTLNATSGIIQIYTFLIAVLISFDINRYASFLNPICGTYERTRPNIVTQFGRKE